MKCAHQIKNEKPEYRESLGAWVFQVTCECGEVMRSHIGRDLLTVREQEEARHNARRYYLLHLEEMRIRGLLDATQG